MLHPSIPRLPRRVVVAGQRIWLVEPAMHDVFATIEQMAACAVPVLVHGETGVGKELAAHAVHQYSPRRHAPLLTINCAALPEGLAESELFGHERGAFSGATTARQGVFEAAAGGTVFLDEIGELSLATQARFLRVLDGATITPLGSVIARPIDVRVVAATNRDLRAEVTAGRFRQDLFYRLCGATVTVPPLRERRRELPMLVCELLRALQAGRPDLRRPVAIDDAALAALAAHAWPGNVRELKHALDYALASAGHHVTVLRAEHLPSSVRCSPPAPWADEPIGNAPAAAPPSFSSLAAELRALEALRMRQALEHTAGVQTLAAALLQMPRRTFVTRMKQYQLGDHATGQRRTARARRAPRTSD